jgi:hypothetical protein
MHLVDSIELKQWLSKSKCADAHAWYDLTMDRQDSPTFQELRKIYSQPSQNKFRNTAHIR